mmetsp:Transcript_30567/g.97549  ORF Transcript_30567/g.97549 Transcript_30567/m.97549 type:complete len:278 (-) Transcript_30567:31-864(-)
MRRPVSAPVDYTRPHNKSWQRLTHARRRLSRCGSFLLRWFASGAGRARGRHSRRRSCSSATDEAAGTSVDVVEPLDLKVLVHLLRIHVELLDELLAHLEAVVRPAVGCVLQVRQVGKALAQVEDAGELVGLERAVELGFLRLQRSNGRGGSLRLHALLGARAAVASRTLGRRRAKLRCLGSHPRRLLADGGRLAALLGAELAGEGPVVGRDADLLLVHEVVAHELLEHVLDCVGDDAELGRVAFDVLHGVHCTRSVKHAEHALLLFVGRHSPLAHVG